MKIKAASLFTALILLVISTPSADEVHARSGNRNDIQAAIDAAPENGMVIIPEGVFNINGPQIRVNKNLTIAGSGNNDTVLRGRSGLDWIFNVVTEGFFRLTNIVLDGQQGNGGVHLRSNDLVMRIDNSRLTNFRNRAVLTHGKVVGVIDNNEFVENGRTDIVVYGDNDDSWDRPLSLGSGDAVYVEDNLFRAHQAPNLHAIASNRGAKYVFRHNTIDVGDQNSNPIDAHGNFYYGRGSRSYEIYGNKIKSGHSYMGMFIRGGTGVIFDNEFEGSFTHPIVLENYRSFNRERGRFASYPAPDQISDLHIWNNSVNGNSAPEPFIHDRGVSRQHIQKNRDFFLSPQRDYQPYIYPHPLAGAQNPQTTTLASTDASPRPASPAPSSTSRRRISSSAPASNTLRHANNIPSAAQKSGDDGTAPNGLFDFGEIWEEFFNALSFRG